MLLLMRKEGTLKRAATRDWLLPWMLLPFGETGNNVNSTGPSVILVRKINNIAERDSLRQLGWFYLDFNLFYCSSW